MVHRNNLLPRFDSGILRDLEPQVVEVGPDGLPKLPAVRPRGGPKLPLER